MDVGSPSSTCSAVSTDRFGGSMRRRSSTRRRRQSVCPTSDNESVKVVGAQTTRPVGCRWSADFDTLLHDCAGLATFSVSAASNPIASHNGSFSVTITGVREMR